MEFANPTPYLVSVIVPVYNVEKYLKQCLDSIIHQTYSRFEVILVDDGSKDSSGTICDEYASMDSRFRVYHQANAGVSSARNLALDQAKGDFVVFVDSDDYVSPVYLEKLIQRQIETGADLTFCNMATDTDGDIHPTYYIYPNSKVVDFNIIKEYFLPSNYFVCTAPWNCLYLRNTISSHRFHTDLNHGEDLLFVVECFINPIHIASVSEVLYYYRLSNANSITHIRKHYLVNELSFYEYVNRIQNEICDSDFNDIMIEYKAISAFYYVDYYFHQINPNNAEMSTFLASSFFESFKYYKKIIPNFKIKIKYSLYSLCLKTKWIWLAKFALKFA